MDECLGLLAAEWRALAFRRPQRGLGLAEDFEDLAAALEASRLRGGGGGGGARRGVLLAPFFF